MIQDIWMRLEALSHLRQLPQLKEMQQKIEAELIEMQDRMLKGPESKAPRAVPAAAIERRE